MDFKLTSVKLNDLPGVQVHTVAEAVDIHPFMLSRWRKEACDGVLKDQGGAWRLAWRSATDHRLTMKLKPRRTCGVYKTEGGSRPPAAAWSQARPGAWGPPLTASVGPTATELQLVKKAIVLSVRPDPEPGDVLILQKPEGTISEGHAGRVNGVAIVNLLEVEARMPGVLAEQAIRLLSEFSDLRWQLEIRRPDARRRA